MNILFKRIGLCISIAFLFAACEEENIVGFELEPNQDNIITEEIVVPLSGSLSRYDTIATEGVGSFLTGRLIDPVFGTVVANTFTEVRPLDINPSIGDTATFKALRLQVSIDNVFGGQLSVDNPQTFTVHQTTQTFSGTKVTPIGALLDFYQFDNVPYNPEPLGTWVVPQRESEEDGGTFFIELDSLFGLQFFDDLRSGAINADEAATVQANFNEYFKGLAFIGADDNDQIFRINGSATMVLQYDIVADSTLEIEFFLNRSTNSFANDVFGFSEIVADRSGTETAFINDTDRRFDLPGGQNYIQSGTGIHPVIELDNLFNLVDTADSFLLNKVILEMEVEDWENGFAPPASIFFDVITPEGFTETENGINVGLLTNGDVAIPNNLAGRAFASFDFDNNVYTIDLTSYTRLLPLVAERAQTDSVERFVTEFQMVPVNLNSTFNRAIFKEDGLRARVIYSTFTR